MPLTRKQSMYERSKIGSTVNHSGSKAKKDCATICFFGKTGTGKSTLANTLLLGNYEENGKPELF